MTNFLNLISVIKFFNLKSSKESLSHLNGALDPLSHMFVDLKILKLLKAMNELQLQ